MFRLCPLFFLLLVLLPDNGLGSSLVKSRSKRSYHHSHSKKLSIKDLALELAKKHLLKMIINEQHDLDKAKESVYILQKDSCTNIKSIGKPVTHNNRLQTQGAWMKDPLGIMGSETIFVMENYGGNELEEFANMDTFKAGIARKKYKLPYGWDGTGGVVYGPYLYYNRAGTNNVVKYNLQTEREEKQIGLAGSARKTSYQWGGYTQVDLAADEHGLWALWGYNGISYKLRVRMIDVYKGTLTHAWHLSSAEVMSSMGNAFVACGVIYCIDSYNSKSTTINFAYDTKTGKQWNPNIQFTNQFGYNSMVAYNPREKVLYAWDNKRLVTYPISFEER